MNGYNVSKKKRKMNKDEKELKQIQIAEESNAMLKQLYLTFFSRTNGYVGLFESQNTAIK